MRKIKEFYNLEEPNAFSEDELFESIMLAASKYDMDRKFRFYEWKVGLRESYIEYLK